ncbi:MAG: hypothetical protein Kow0096_09590 [Thiohalomonadaceae bacterium]
MADDTPILLFGAFDRHNFGDLLFPHIAAALLPGSPLIYAGLAARDLRPYGGHQTRAIAPLALELRDQPLHILHVGGELLACDAWEAAVMLQRPEQAQAVIARCGAQPETRRAWAERILGLGDQAPYCAARALFPQAQTVSYCAVGGVDLPQRDAALQNEVMAKLHGADSVSVRDQVTQSHLAAAGIDAMLLPDPAVMVRELFDAEIQRHARHGEAAQVRAAFPQGYLAVQLSADFGDDTTLAAIAAQLDAIARATGFAIVLFRAGAAPWHDDLACYRRLAACMHAPAIWLFGSLHLWAICALIAHSRGYCGSSLHGRIVAMAHGLPRINVRQPAATRNPSKQQAYCASWELPGLPTEVALEEIAAAWSAAAAAPHAVLRQQAAEMAHEYRGRFARLTAGLT